MNDGGPARCVALHAHPVSHAGPVNGRLNRETELAREFRIGLCLLIADEACTPVDGRDAGQALSRLQERGGLRFKPAIESQVSQFHGRILYPHRGRLGC